MGMNNADPTNVFFICCAAVICTLIIAIAGYNIAELFAK